MLTVPQLLLTVHQHHYSIFHPHCSSASTITPSLDHPQTSITGPSLHLWHHNYTIISPNLHLHRTTTNSTTPFFIMKTPTISLQQYTSTTTNTPSPYYRILTTTNSPSIQTHYFSTSLHHYISSTSPLHHLYIKTSSTPLFQHHCTSSTTRTLLLYQYCLSSTTNIPSLHCHHNSITTTTTTAQ